MCDARHFDAARPVCVPQVLGDGAEPRKLGEGLENIAYGRCLLSVVDKAEGMWRMLVFHPKSTIITGGCGFIGSNFMYYR